MATKKSSYKPTYITATAPTAPDEYKPTAVAPEQFVSGTYNSQYGDRLSSALDTVTNWKYDPLQDASYQALAKIYGARGNEAAKNSMADAAALNGGYGTSYAVSAAQQARNQYNQELAAMIPDLEANAFNRAQTTYNALRDADESDYGRWRDAEGDRWQQWQQNYNAYRDQVSDEQWLYSQNYQKYQDALNQYQWALNYNTDLYQWNKLHASSGGGGGRRRRSGGGGGGGGGGYSSSGGGISSLYRTPNKKPPRKPTATGGGGGHLHHTQQTK